MCVVTTWHALFPQHPSFLGSGQTSTSPTPLPASPSCRQWAQSAPPQAWLWSAAVCSSRLGPGSSHPSLRLFIPYPQAHTLCPDAWWVPDKGYGRAALQCPLFPWLQKEKLSAQASLKRHTSLNDLSLTRDEQEIEFLRLQVLEQQHVIDDLSLVCLRLHQCQALLGVPGDMGLQNGIRAASSVGAQGGRGASHGAPPGDGGFLLHSSRKQPPLALHNITRYLGAVSMVTLFAQPLCRVCCH